MLQPRKTKKKKLTPMESDPYVPMEFKRFIMRKTSERPYLPTKKLSTPTLGSEPSALPNKPKGKSKMYNKITEVNKKVGEKMSGAAMTIKDKLNKAVERAQAGRSSKLYSKATKAKEQGEMKQAGKLMKKFEKGVRRRMQ